MRFRIFKSPMDIFISIEIRKSKYAYFGEGGYIFFNDHPLLRSTENIVNFKFPDPSVKLCHVMLSGFLK